ncbi:uncharacterized protein MONOS_16456 [Monocercomonoides exilis]|uniref:uncharacterized protein n=1 Tax=Monocercomonoides exilis TaxID=2049356 RepID=UPI00355A1B60|nr:hypothetical protein MONOS_16456 [Monocercomonoides exilis]|eukprot:MONOS_16456.1-p1 / transcript=MONOS_16456.1 / gene=MONOS_16456 / organism=Monocercomonoides_exilis_PA203 / gene_product=unspecified product / transcript_product=unspecified product / location=Mono_scaffold01756:540-2909(-) / protein_length=632 / sequence_SO=supercontig / SO=protein_coding / is_pseudo=false
MYLLGRIAWILQKEGMETVNGTEIDTLVDRMHKTTRLVININKEDYARMYSKLSLFRRKANVVYTQQTNQEILTQISSNLLNPFFSMIIPTLVQEDAIHQLATSASAQANVTDSEKGSSSSISCSGSSGGGGNGGVGYGTTVLPASSPLLSSFAQTFPFSSVTEQINVPDHLSSSGSMPDSAQVQCSKTKNDQAGDCEHADKHLPTSSELVTDTQFVEHDEGVHRERHDIWLILQRELFTLRGDSLIRRTIETTQRQMDALSAELERIEEMLHLESPGQPSMEEQLLIGAVKQSMDTIQPVIPTITTTFRASVSLNVYVERLSNLCILGEHAAGYLSVLSRTPRAAINRVRLLFRWLKNLYFLVIQSGTFDEVDRRQYQLSYTLVIKESRREKCPDLIAQMENERAQIRRHIATITKSKYATEETVQRGKTLLIRTEELSYSLNKLLESLFAGLSSLNHQMRTVLGDVMFTCCVDSFANPMAERHRMSTMRPIPELEREYEVDAISEKSFEIDAETALRLESMSSAKQLSDTASVSISASSAVAAEAEAEATASIQLASSSHSPAITCSPSITTTSSQTSEIVIPPQSYSSSSSSSSSSASSSSFSSSSSTLYHAYYIIICKKKIGHYQDS